MFHFFREAVKEVTNSDVPPYTREYRPHKLFYSRPFEFKPLPPTLQEKWFIWRNNCGSFSFPYLEALVEIDVTSFILGGTAMLIYSYISGDISFGYRSSWPSAHSSAENSFPLDRITTFLGIKAYTFARYAGKWKVLLCIKWGILEITLVNIFVLGRFIEGGGIYSIMRCATFLIVKERLSPFKRSLISSTLFAIWWGNRRLAQHRVWRIVNGLWTGLAIAYLENASEVYFQAVYNISSSKTPLR